MLYKDCFRSEGPLFTCFPSSSRVFLLFLLHFFFNFTYISLYASRFPTCFANINLGTFTRTRCILYYHNHIGRGGGQIEPCDAKISEKYTCVLTIKHCLNKNKYPCLNLMPESCLIHKISG